MTQYLDYAQTLSLAYASKGSAGVGGYSSPSTVGSAGTVVDGYAFWETATSTNRGGDAVSLNGTTQAMTIPAATMNSAINGGSFSMIVWIKRNSSGTPGAVEAFGSGTIGSNIIIISPNMNNSFGTDSTRARVVFYGSGQCPDLNYLHSGAANDGQWRMLGFVFTATGGVSGAGGTLSIIYDGRVAATVSCTAAQVPTALANDFGIGAYFNPSGSFWMPWSFDYLTLHTKALSQTEITRLYNVFHGHGTYLASTYANRTIENGQVLRDISLGQLSKETICFGVGDSQYVRNVGGSATPLATGTDQGFAHFDARMLRFLDRGRRLKGLIMAPSGPDPSTAYINGGICWETNGSSGTASPPAHVLSRSPNTDNVSASYINGCRIGTYYNAAPDSAVSGTVGNWAYTPDDADGRSKLDNPFTPRFDLQYFTFASGGGASKPAMYKISDGTVIAGGNSIAHTGSDGVQILTLTGSAGTDFPVGLSIFRDSGGAGTTTRATAFGFCIFSNAASSSKTYHGTLWSRGGYDLNHWLEQLAAGGSNARSRVANAILDIANAIQSTSSSRNLVIWMHTGSNIINGTFAALTAYNSDYTSSATLARNAAGYKLDVQTFMATIRTLLGSSFASIRFVLGPYMGNNSSDFQLLRRAEREIAADDSNVCMIYGDNMYSADQIVALDGTGGDMTFDTQHLNFTGFENYAESTEQLALRYRAKSGLSLPILLEMIGQ